MKRIFKWTAIVMGGCLAVLSLIGAVWEQVARRQVAAAYPAPGRLVDIGGRRMQIECRGTGSPTVVFETGLDYFGSLNWVKVYGPVAELTHACAYSRAGIAWSDDKAGLHDGLGVAHDLHATLAAVGEHGPFVLVGLSLGGPYISIYTGLYGDQVAGLVYVDASHPDQLRRFEAVLGQKQDGRMNAILQGAGGKLSWVGAPRLVAVLARRNRAATVPREIREISLAFFPTSLGPMVAERNALPTTLAEAGSYRHLGTRPVVVLTHGAPMPDMSTVDAESFDKVWLEMQQDMRTWSSQGKQRTISDAGHNIANDDPGAVIAAIQEVVNDVRSASAESDRPDPASHKKR
jgi:pimeloyl-ACP methyl ester carboxylesterase